MQTNAQQNLHPPPPKLEKHKTPAAYLFSVLTFIHARDSIQPSQKGEAER